MLSQQRLELESAMQAQQQPAGVIVSSACCAVTQMLTSSLPIIAPKFVFCSIECVRYALTQHDDDLDTAVYVDPGTVRCTPWPRPLLTSAAPSSRTLCPFDPCLALASLQPALCLVSSVTLVMSHGLLPTRFPALHLLPALGTSEPWPRNTLEPSDSRSGHAPRPRRARLRTRRDHDVYT